MGIYWFKKILEKKLDRKVDLVTKGALKPELEEDILKEVIYQWEETFYF